MLPAYVSQARKIIQVALACVEHCPEAFQVVAFGIFLKHLLEREEFPEEEG